MPKHEELTEEQRRVESQQQSAETARNAELERRKIYKDAQKKLKTTDPFVTSA